MAATIVKIDIAGAMTLAALIAGNDFSPAQLLSTLAKEKSIVYQNGAAYLTVATNDSAKRADVVLIPISSLVGVTESNVNRLEKAMDPLAATRAKIAELRKTGATKEEILALLSEGETEDVTPPAEEGTPPNG